VSSFTWWAVVPSTVGGLIGGGFAVLGMWVTGRRERRRVRESLERDALLAARQSLLAIEDLYATDRDSELNWTLSEAGSQKEQRLLREIVVHAATIGDDKVREFLELSARVIGSGAVQQFHGDRDAQVSYKMCTYGKHIISARLTGGELPPEPAFVSKYRSALEDAEEAWRQQWEEEHDKLRRSTEQPPQADR
jgi:hypothetical protein